MLKMRKNDFHCKTANFTGTFCDLDIPKEVKVYKRTDCDPLWYNCIPHS